jgi:hypothetical protein
MVISELRDFIKENIVNVNRVMQFVDRSIKQVRYIDYHPVTGRAVKSHSSSDPTHLLGLYTSLVRDVGSKDQSYLDLSN